MAVPLLKLACNAWHFGPMGAAVDRVCPFCGDPPVDSLTHFVVCPALFGTISEVLPRFPWAPAAPVRTLEFLGAGATVQRRVLFGDVLDALWAVLVAQQRSANSVRFASKARLDAMARLSPHLANVLDGVGPVPAMSS